MFLLIKLIVPFVILIVIQVTCVSVFIRFISKTLIRHILSPLVDIITDYNAHIISSLYIKIIIVLLYLVLIKYYLSSVIDFTLTSLRASDSLFSRFLKYIVQFYYNKYYLTNIKLPSFYINNTSSALNYSRSFWDVSIRVEIEIIMMVKSRNHYSDINCSQKSYLKGPFGDFLNFVLLQGHDDYRFYLEMVIRHEIECYHLAYILFALSLSLSLSLSVCIYV